MNAYLKIVERKGQLGVCLVNGESEFFLFGRMLLSMWKNRGQYVLVKQHNASTKSAIGYHPGQVVGLIEESEEEVIVQICKGGVGRKVELDVNHVLVNIVEREKYVFSAPDLKAVVAAFEVNQRHRLEFEELSLLGAQRVLS